MFLCCSAALRPLFQSQLSKSTASACTTAIRRSDASIASQRPNDVTFIDADAPPAALSRWQLLKRARRAAPAPKRRSSHEFDRSLAYSLPAALAHVRASSWAHFDETVELVFRLNIDPRKAEQNLRGAADLPHGTGAPVRIAVFAHPGPAADDANEAGAELVGAEDLIDAVVHSRGKNLADFTACLATPEIVPTLAAKVGRILGPKGLMPSAKLGSVTGRLAEAIATLSRGQCKYRTDRNGNVHLVAGKLSFIDEKLIENCLSLTRAIVAARPESVRRKYIKAIYMSSAMGPSAMIDIDSITKTALNARPQTSPSHTDDPEA
jgi:large subunit ribosomal protein L1